MKEIKTITLEKLKELMNQDGWEVKVEAGIAESYDSETNDPDSPNTTTYMGDVFKTSTLGGVSITYLESHSFDESEPSTLNVSCDGLVFDDQYEINGVVVINEDGEEMDTYDVIHEVYLNDLNEFPNDFFSISHDEALEALNITECVQIDFNENSEMEAHYLTVHNEPDVEFNGELMAEATERNYGNNQSRWTNLEIYKTEGGKFIFYKKDCSIYGNVKDIGTIEISDSLENAEAFFGNDELASRLYENLEEYLLDKEVDEVFPPLEDKKAFENKLKNGNDLSM